MLSNNGILKMRNRLPQLLVRSLENMLRWRPGRPSQQTVQTHIKEDAKAFAGIELSDTSQDFTEGIITLFCQMIFYINNLLYYLII